MAFSSPASGKTPGDTSALKTRKEPIGRVNIAAKHQNLSIPRKERRKAGKNGIFQPAFLAHRHTAPRAGRYNMGMKKSIKILLVATFVFVAYIFCSIALFSTVDQKKTADAAIILGAAAWYKRPSPVFEERIRHGIWLYENGYVRKLILTGGKSKNAPFSEAFVARRYALSHAIPGNDILIEEASQTTRENLLNAKEIMQENGLSTAIIVSDPMHMKRAMQIAGDIGLTAWSSPTPSTRYESFRAKISFLMQETWHMIGYFIYPKGLPERPAAGNGT